MSLLLRKRTVSGKAALKLLDDAHAALHYNQEILQTALNHVRQGIAVFNREHQLICSNRQFGEILDLPPRIIQVGVTLEEILETIRPKVTHPPSDDASFVATRLAAYTTEGTPHLERFAERNLVVEVRANRMPDGVVITFSDITQSVEAAEALERANATLERRVRERTEELTRLNSELARAKGEADEANLSKTRFLAAAGHDLLQPLNAARLYVTSLVERQIGGEDARLVGNIDGSLDQIEQLLGALLDISRLDAGALKPSLTSFRASDVLRTLRVEFAPIARAKGLELTFVLSSQPIHSDKTMLLRLLQNLISNAIKYTPRGKVLVGCRRRGKSLRIDVYDTGIGIPVCKAQGDLQGVPSPRPGRADRARPRPRPVDRAAHGARAQSRPGAGLEPRRRLALLGDRADDRDRHPCRHDRQRDVGLAHADAGRADRGDRERAGDPRRHAARSSPAGART